MTDAKPVLWGIGTMRTHRPHWLARELGIDYELRPIQPRTGETREPAYLKINPRHKVPAMVHGDVVLTESAAILNYLSETFPVPEWFFVPSTALERARLLEWNFFIMSELDANGLYSMRRHGDLKALYGDAPVAVEAGRDYFLHQLETMDEALRRATDGFLMGHRFIIADVLFMSILDWARWYKIDLPAYLLDWQHEIGRRPAYIDTFADNYPGMAVADVR